MRHHFQAAAITPLFACPATAQIDESSRFQGFTDHSGAAGVLIVFGDNVEGVSLTFHYDY